MVIIGVVAFAFYAPSLQFGFFNDDPTGHFRWMEGRSIGSLLTDASGHGYYRPFSFILWQILHSILGQHDPFALHLLNVLAHAANAALVCWLAHQLTDHPIYASLAGLLFALYPFSYEAVPYVGSFVHPLVTLFVLLTLTFYLQWRQGNARWAFAVAHVTLTLGVFTQENAVIAPVLLLALSLVKAPRPRVLLRALSFLVEPVVFAAAWLIVPKLPEVRTLSLEAMRANVLPFVQALIYPIAPLANRSATTLGILAALSLMALVALAWQARTQGLLTFGLLTWGLASLPSILILDNAYVLGSPRLFYLASVGVTLIWAMPVLIAERLLKLRGYWTLGIGVLVFAVCYLPSAGYVRCQLMYQGLAGDVGRLMAEAARATPPERSVTFVNLPYFFSSRGSGTECRSPFVFAPTGAVVIPPYADTRDFVIYNGGPDRPTLALAIRDYRPGGQTFGDPASIDQLRQQLGSSHVWVFDLIRWRLFDLSAAWQPSAPPVQAQYTMNGVQISNVKSQTSKDRAVVSLTWQVITPTPNVKVFAHVYNGNGKLVAQDDSLPADGFVPAAWCKPGDVITDTRTVVLTGLPAGTYRVTAGMYHEINTTRFEVRDASGARLPDDEILITHIVR